MVERLVAEICEVVASPLPSQTVIPSECRPDFEARVEGSAFLDVLEPEGRKIRARVQSLAKTRGALAQRGLKAWAFYAHQSALERPVQALDDSARRAEDQSPGYKARQRLAAL